ncbi:MAG: protein kinase [Planctomycetes bacterium]|nr:protein kinase [Planctomycetota bacterium]
MDGQPNERSREFSAEAIEGWVAEFAARRERGEALTARAFATERPLGGERLLRALLALEHADALLPGVSSDVPDRVGPYAVLGELGRGGMGRVFRVEHHARPGEVLALKLLHDSLQHDLRALERFRREAQALERVRHAGVVRSFESGVDAGRPYLVMDLVDGVPLSRLLAEARTNGAAQLALPGAHDRYLRAAELVARAARAVAAAHAEGVLHRDLNPRNVILRPDGEPVLVDFGLVHAEGSKTLTGTGDLIGTPQYMAPEQARGERVDERVDVFGLGAILFELTTLEPPRSAEETLALLRQASDLPLPSPRSRNAAMPPALARIVADATAFRPAWRYSDAGALAEDLEAFVAGRPIAARSPGLARTAQEFWLRRRRTLVFAGSAAAVLAVPLVFWLGGVFAAAPPDAEQVRALRSRAIVGLLDGDLATARDAEEELAQLLPDDAREEVLRALVNGNLPASSSDPAVNALIEGERLRRAGRPAEAIAQFDVSWNLAPGSLLVAALRGLARLEAGHFVDAAGAFEPLAYDLGASLTVHRSLGRAYEGLGKTADAVKAREAARALAPNDPEVGFDLARALHADGRRDDALREARRVLALDDPAGRSSCAEFARQLEARGLTGDAAAYEQLARD